jgi:uncharacterized membrane protein YfcA
MFVIIGIGGAVIGVLGAVIVNHLPGGTLHTTLSLVLVAVLCVVVLSFDLIANETIADVRHWLHKFFGK